MNNSNDIHSKNFWQVLNQPYPFYYKNKELFVVCGILLVMSWAFNYFFEPFHVNPKEHKVNYVWVCFIHALVAPIVLVLLSLFWPKRITEEKWIIKREIVFLTLFLLMVGIGQFLIRDIVYDNPNNWSFRYLYEEIRNTFLVGTLFILILIPLNFTRLNAKHIKRAHLLNVPHNPLMPSKNSKIEINTNLKNDSFQLDINNLLFAKAEGNYVEFYMKENGINRIIKRITIKELEAILEAHPNIVRIHRSYLINAMHVKNVTGNAQGYRLQLDSYEEPIPVSRNMIEHFNSRMEQLH